jgi:NAD(P)H-hydrate epimerase
MPVSCYFGPGSLHGLHLRKAAFILTNIFYKPWSKAPLLSAEGFKELDRYALREGIPESVLVENAGRVFALEVLKVYQKEARSKKPDFEILAVVGKGNNAADVLVAVRYLHEAGIGVCVLRVKSGKDGTPEFLRNLSLVESLGIRVEMFSEERFTKLHSVVVLDGLLGTGLKGEVTDVDYLSAIHCINTTSSYVVSADIPSGLDADGKESSTSVKADKTVSFSGMKFAFLSEEHKSKTGEVVCYDIGIPKSFYSKSSMMSSRFRVYQKPYVWDRELSEFGHKYDRGHVMVFAGSKGKMGAASLATYAAQRAGAGWVSLAMSAEDLKKMNWDGRDHRSDYDASIVFEEVLNEDGTIQVDVLRELTINRKVKSILFGPGWTRNFIDETLMKFIQEFSLSGGYVIFDAGAVHGLLPLLERFPLNPANSIALPHPGEWAKMGGELARCKIDTMDQLVSVAEKVRALNALSLVWKSAVPIFFAPDLEENFINLFPENRMAKAGMGDVLAGLTAGSCSRIGHVSRAAANGHAALVRSVRSMWLRENDSATPEQILSHISVYL